MSVNISPKYVPYEGKEGSPILFIGEAPGSDEEQGTVTHPMPGPFIGDSGTLLRNCLGRNGLYPIEDTVYLANLSHYRPKDNKFEYLLGSTELAEGLGELRTYILKHRPTVICTLGNWPLYFITGKHGKKPGSGILNWRGSILTTSVDMTPLDLSGPVFPGKQLFDAPVKVIPTVHPAAVLRDRKLYPIFDQDIKRVVLDSAFRDLKLPVRNFIIAPVGAELEHYVQVFSQSDKLSVDIETFGPTIACVGFSIDPSIAVCIVNDGSIYFIDAITRILASSAKKIFHYGTFDTEMLHISGQEVNNYWWDNMVAQHVMWPELPRSHKYLASVLTREPYYKDEGKESLGNDKKVWGKRTDRNKLWKYNCKDDATEYEVQQCQEKEMAEGPPAWKKFFEFEMAQLEVAAHISRAGMLVDQERRALLELAVTYKYVTHLDILERLTYKGFNVNSHPQVQTLLYETLKLPIQRKRNSKVTADEDALVTLIGLCKGKTGTLRQAGALGEWQRKFLIVKMIMLIRGYRKMLSSYLKAKISGDGRMRSTYKVPATETGRWSAEKYVDGTGVNAMTLPREAIEIPEDVNLVQFKTIVTGIEAETEDDEQEESEEEVT